MKAWQYFGLVIGALAVIFVAALFQSANPFDEANKTINIPVGSNSYSVQSILEENGVVSKQSAFALISRVVGVSKHIKAGEYALSPSEPLIAVLWKLQAGQVVPARADRVTFPEGTSIYKMGTILQAQGFRDWERFQGLVNEGITADLRNRHWTLFKYMPTESLEGYLFPDTYQFYLAASAETMAEVMIKRFEQVVLPFWEKAQKDTKLNLHEIITLASIIEKEAKKTEERAIISSVFQNRLQAGMPLSADPTIKYALERPTKRVYLDQLSVQSLYNTYKRRGLPPGPICNPGLESIKAAVYPAKTNYYFFVAKADGSHIFSATWEEHQRARGAR